MTHEIQKVIIVGGGSAGWLTAAVLASEHRPDGQSGLEITLIESADVAPLGVGEGTWPSMRNTLQKIGISETEFLVECDASFKQGSKFNAWLHGKSESYYHPFTPPSAQDGIDLYHCWQPHRAQISFADAVCPQSKICDAMKAPKQLSTKDYAFNVNYGYHLDAGKFVNLLKRHCVEKLGVVHIVDHVEGAKNTDSGDIRSIVTSQSGELHGDLFVDCSGAASLLIGRHYQVPFVELKETLFNDTALAVQVPYSDLTQSIASTTLSTATSGGWIWDIGLYSRRGIGHTYSSSHLSDSAAEAQLRAYIEKTESKKVSNELNLRKISFSPGHRKHFWYKNCVAIGVAAGFIEPLEASALVMIELSAKMLSQQLPKTRRDVKTVSKRFNRVFLGRWQEIIDFLKLHYVLSKRTDSRYWIDNREEQSIPDSVLELLSFWENHSPSKYDLQQAEPLFPAASFQYVLYGMNFKRTTNTSLYRHVQNEKVGATLLQSNSARAKQLVSNLPDNREFLRTLNTTNLPTLSALC